ncbi:cuticle protein 6 isoform X2 [Procambarus clarkii]
MQQVELEYLPHDQRLSTYDGYRYDNTFRLGEYSFLYSLPTSWRSEQRSASGEVTGGYGFVAPEGEEFQFRYQAGQDGFKVESNALPVPPEDTDEVKRAKEEFFVAYQKALELVDSDEDYDGDSSSQESSEEEVQGFQEESSEEDDAGEESGAEDEDEGESDKDADKEGEEEEERSPVPFQNLVRQAGFGQKVRRPYPQKFGR